MREARDQARRSISSRQGGVYPVSRRFEEDLELVVRCDRLGYEEAWIGQHHTAPGRPVAAPAGRSDNEPGVADHGAG